MKTFFLATLLLFTLPLQSRADSAADVKGLPVKEFKELMDAYEIALTPIERELLLNSIQNSAREKQAKLGALRAKLLKADSPISMRDIITFMDEDGSRATAAKVASHKDPLVSFYANCQLIGAGNSEAAKRVHQLIHSQELSTQQKRLLKTWCSGVGIRAKTDTAEQIYDSLRTGMSGVPKLKPGDAAPEFKIKDVTGKTISLKQLRGKVVVLHFWATWCNPCMMGMDSVKKELSVYPSDQVVVISVSLDDDQKACDMALKKFELPWYNVIDGAGWGGELARAYGINAVPFYIVIDGVGTVRSNNIKDIPQVLSNRANSKQPATIPKTP